MMRHIVEETVERGLVSVIIPTYNRGALIRETIQSVVNQTYKSIEVLVIDDGSTDNTREIVEYINDSRIKYCWFENSGLPAVARNRGLRIARGEYIAFQDSDDLWVLDKLQKQIDYLEKHRDIFLLYSQHYIQKDGELIGVSPLTLKAGYIFHELYCSYNFIPIITVVMRNRGLANQYFNDEDKRLRAIEDYDLWLTIARSEKIGYIKEPLAIYRVHPGNISLDAVPFLKRFKLVMKKHAPYVPKWMKARRYMNYYSKYCITCIKVSLRRMLDAISRKHDNAG